MRARPDLPTLVAGLAIIALGSLVLLHERGEIELTFGILGPVACAALGAVLLATGLARRG